MFEPPLMVDELTVRTGAGMTVNSVAADVPPPGAGVTTVIGQAPATARSAADSVASNCVELTNVVGRGDPFHASTDDDVNLLPSTWTVTGAEPATADVGDIDATTGAGLIEASTVTTGLVATRVNP